MIGPYEEGLDSPVFTKNWTDYVYVLIASHGCLLAKVGVSADPMRRIKELSTGSAIPFVEVWLSQVDGRGGAFALERRLHFCLREYRKRGEWFRVVGSIKEFIYKCEKIRTGSDVASAPFVCCTDMSAAFKTSIHCSAQKQRSVIRSEIAAERAQRRQFPGTASACKATRAEREATPV